MAHIRIKQAHTMPLADAKKAAQEVTDKLGAKFEMKSNWEGDVLHFKRSGVDGHLSVTTKEATIDIKLGFMLGMMSGRIETEAKAMMSEVFAKKAGKGK